MTFEGAMCPWPWEPMTLTNQVLGQYICSFCGDLVVAGLLHPDYTDLPPSPFDTLSNWGVV